MLINHKDSKVYELYTQCHGSFLENNSYLKGRLLTLADASFTDPQQRKAFKDLLAQEVDSNFRTHAREQLILTFQQVGKLMGETLFADYDDARPSLS